MPTHAEIAAAFVCRPFWPIIVLYFLRFFVCQTKRRAATARQLHSKIQILLHIYVAKHVDTATHTHASTDCSNCNCKASAAFVYNYKNCLQPWQSARRVAYLCCPLSFFSSSSSSSHCLHMFNYSPSHSFAVAAETVRAIRLIDRLTHRG